MAETSAVLPADGLTAGARPKLVGAGLDPAAMLADERMRIAVDLFVRVEAEARRAETKGELAFLIANESLQLTRARQIYVLADKGRGMKIAAVSSVSQVDRYSPRILWIESMVAALGADVGLGEPRDFVLPAYCAPDDGEAPTYPFRFLFWQPLTLRDGHVFAGLLLAREIPWTEGDRLVGGRLADVFSHAWCALVGPARLKPKARRRPGIAAVLAAVLLVGLFPIPLTVLAPVSVTSIEPKIVAAPFDGVVESIEIQPNAAVVKGTPLLTMSDTVIRNDMIVAEREVDVAQATLKQVTQAAVSDPKMRGDLALSRSELRLATARRDYARDLYDRSRVLAPETGLAVFTDARDWVGRPVMVGERIIEIVDPQRIELQIDVPVADAVALVPGAPVKAILDSDPFWPVAGTIRSISVEARPTAGGVLAYRVYARIDEKDTAARIGIYGTARISGTNVPLAFYLLRRPVSAFRQWIGL